MNASSQPAPVAATERPSDDSTDGLDPRIKALIEKGKERGFVTYDEINAIIPDELVSPDKLDALLQKMDDLEIEVVEASADEEEKEDAAAVDPDESEREKEEPRARKDPTATGSTVRIDDPVRLYLTQMGEIPLLTREDELRLASRIELTRKRFRTKVLESPIAIAESIKILEDIRNGDLAFDRTLKADSSLEVPRMDVLERLPGIIDQLRKLLFDSSECYDP